MFYFFSKLLLFLIQPLTWIFGLLLISLFIRPVRWKRRCLRASVGLALLLTNPLLSNLALWCWEAPPVKIADISPGYSTGLVLGGYLSYSKEQAEDYVTFNEFGNRLANALELYGEGKIQYILLSGRYGSEPTERDATDNEAVRYLTRIGFPADRLMVEYQARNTYENILFSEKLLESKGLAHSKVILLTSAFHIPRAMAVARKQGLDCQPFPTDRLRRSPSWKPVDWLIPNSFALHVWEILFKEWAGMAMYRATGYL